MFVIIKKEFGFYQTLFFIGNIMYKLILILIFLWRPLFAIVVVLDAGHGGKDPGYHSHRKYKSEEKQINLLVVKQLGKILKQKIENIKVIYTRQDDTFHNLDKRVEIANQNLADLFISIHCNSSSNQSFSGFRIHIHNHSLIKDSRLAKSITKSVRQSTKQKVLSIQDAHDRNQNLQIIQYTEMPSLLIELGFLSNQREEEFLHTTRGQIQLAQSIAAGIKNFLAREKLTPTGRYQIYKIQLAAFTTSPDLTRAQRAEILDMRLETYAQITKPTQFSHLIGHYHSYKEAQANLTKIKAKGFSKAFIVRVR